ncbi:MAG: hypothetical protein ACR2GL_08730 [Thermoleophilaceae bacterium]
MTIVVEKLDDGEYVARAQSGHRRDQLRGSTPEEALRHACDWAAKEVRRDESAPR